MTDLIIDELCTVVFGGMGILYKMPCLFRVAEYAALLKYPRADKKTATIYAAAVFDQGLIPDYFF